MHRLPLPRIDQKIRPMSLLQVKLSGITFGTFACLAKCQGLAVNAVYGSNSTVEDFREIVKLTCTEPTATMAASRRQQQHEEQEHEEQEQEHRPESFLVVSYTRRVIRQTGTGHFCDGSRPDIGHGAIQVRSA
jgi:hypothetical protein